MTRLLRNSAFAISLFMLSAALPIMAQVAQPNVPAEHQQSAPRLQIVPWRDPNSSPTGFAAPAGAHLSYFGGPVVTNAHVVQVLYGSGSFLPQLTTTTTPSMASFFSDILGLHSGYINLLAQYNTPASGGTNQTIGNGIFDGLFQIVPSAANNGSTINDTQIQAELMAQISAGRLPAPVYDAAGNADTIYMIFFPPGKTLVLNNITSCVAGGFCAYHGTTSATLNSKHVLYGVHPDMQSGGCSTGCGASTTFGNYTSVSSHELTETITDAFVGLATTFGPPLAWYDQTNNAEIGDLCNAQQGAYTANGTTYTIQLEFSNVANNCVLPPPANSANFSLSASPASIALTAGSSGTTTVTVAATGGFTGNVSLSATGLPAGATASFSPSVITTSGSSTLTLSTTTTTATGSFPIVVAGTSGALSNTTTLSLSVTAGSGQAISISPTSISFGTVSDTSPPVNKNVTLTNSGSGTIAISSIQLANGSIFFISANSCGTSLAVGASCVVTITFDPSLDLSGSDTLVISDSVPGSPQNVPISGTSKVPKDPPCNPVCP
jgi:hypothetical protein